jgi:hypothetical protein
MTEIDTGYGYGYCYCYGSGSGSGDSPEDPKIISSQRYLDDEAVEEKKQELIDSEATSVDIPVIKAN